MSQTTSARCVDVTSSSEVVNVVGRRRGEKVWVRVDAPHAAGTAAGCKARFAQRKYGPSYARQSSFSESNSNARTRSTG